MSIPIDLAAQRVLALRRMPSVPEAEWERARGAFRSAVSAAKGIEPLRAVLDRDAEALLLPPGLKCAVYERLLDLDGRSPSTLREYAWHLRLYGPDRDEEADLLMDEARRGAEEGATVR